MKRTKWFIYTVAVGLIPFALRLLIFLALNDKSSIKLFDAIDFIILGLVIHINNINVFEGNNLMIRKEKTIIMGISVLAITFFSGLLTLDMIASSYKEIFSQTNILFSSIVLAIASFIFGFSVYKFDPSGSVENE